MLRGCHGHVRMIVGFTTTYAINAYHHLRCEFESRSCEVYLIQHYVIKFISDLWQVGGFLRVLRFHATKKTDRHNITEILLKVVLNTIAITPIKNGVTLFFFLRQYLMGDHLEKVVHDSMTKCLTKMAEETGPFDPEPYIDLMVFNVLNAVCYGER